MFGLRSGSMILGVSFHVVTMILGVYFDDFKGVPGVRLICSYALRGNTIHEEQASYAPNATI